MQDSDFCNTANAHVWLWWRANSWCHKHEQGWEVATHTSKHVAGRASNVERLAARVSLDQRHCIGNEIAVLIAKPSDAQARLLGNSNLSSAMDARYTQFLCEPTVSLDSE
jgi:hypothetical protein